MENLLYIAAIIAAIAFLVLCISLAVTLFSVKKTLNNVVGILEGLDTNLQNVTKETADLLHKTNELAEDIQQKSVKLNTVVDAVKDVGSSVSGLNQSIQRITSSVTSEVEKNEEKIAQVVQWSNVILSVRDKWKERKALESTGYYSTESEKK